MKNILAMKKITVILSLLMILTANEISFSQQSASAHWPLTNPDDGGTGLSSILSGQVEAPGQHLNNMEINQYTGPNNSQRVRIEGNEWPANQTTEIEDVYLQFEVSPVFGNIFNVNQISLNIAGVSINTMKANIYYSTNPDFSERTEIEYDTGDDSGNNYLPRDGLLNVSTTPDLELADDETLYIRIYPWVDNDPDVRTGKYIAIQDMQINGVTESQPIPAIANWPLNTSEEPVITGSLVAQNQSYSPAMSFYDFTDLPAVEEDTTVTTAAIQTISQDWIAATGPVDSLYIQYEVEPKFGGTFYTDNFSIRLGAWFTNNIRAEILYDKDETFENPTVLIPDTSLTADAVERFNATFQDTVETGEKLFVRIYPYNTESEGWAKLVVIDDVSISGTTVGVTADPPDVGTFNISYISTTSASSGGTINKDGGAPVSARGVVWNTEGDPTIDDNYTTDGTGSGSFNSQITGLTPNTTYYVRAYATNNAGTGYGGEVDFTTRETIEPPTVSTKTTRNILAISAEAGGNVTDWGGDSVSVKGVVWSTDPEPTTDDYLTDDGDGLAEFQSALYPLNEETTYFVRAYATNSVGTGYGNTQTFTTKSSEPDITKTVAQDGSGDYTTVQEAFDDVPDFYTGTWTIHIMNGTYYEKLMLEENKVNVQLIGEDVDNTVLVYDDYAGIAGGTSQSYSVSIDADDFVAKNITFQNTVENDKSESNQQAVALSTNGDRQAYYNCKVLGFQDTYYARGSKGTGRIYFKNSFIEGSVDFIFGRNIVLFDSTRIHINREGGVLTAAATEAESEYGFVFKDGEITADEMGFDGREITEFYLGRPWQNAPRTVFINMHMPETLHPAGWMPWNVTPALYGEYNTIGPGANPDERAGFSRQLTEEEAQRYTIEQIFSKESNPGFAFDWNPEEPDVVVSNEPVDNEVPVRYNLGQNYPNPFNPTTSIEYSIPKTSDVSILLYDLLGREIRQLVNTDNHAAGNHIVTVDGSSLSSGVYFYQLRSDRYIQTRKLTLIK